MILYILLSSGLIFLLCPLFFTPISKKRQTTFLVLSGFFFFLTSFTHAFSFFFPKASSESGVGYLLCLEVIHVPFLLHKMGANESPQIRFYSRKLCQEGQTKRKTKISVLVVLSFPPALSRVHFLRHAQGTVNHSCLHPNPHSTKLKQKGK